MLDIHSHIIFGVDDGPETIGQSRDMLKAAKQAEITQIVATPHLRSSKLDIERIKMNFKAVKEIAATMGISLLLGYEVHYCSLLDFGIKHMADFCIEGTNMLLLEFPESGTYLNDKNAIYSLQREGIDIIIAHPERYPIVQRDIEQAKYWGEMGCKLQLDALSLLEGIGSSYKKCAKELMAENLIEYYASDAHSAYDYVRFKKALHLINKFI